MIKSSTAYALAIDGVIVTKGSKAAMHKLRKRRGGLVWLTPKAIGERIGPEPGEGDTGTDRHVIGEVIKVF